MAKELLLGLLGVLVTGLAFGGWGASEYLNAKYAARDAVLVAEAKATLFLTARWRRSSTRSVISSERRRTRRVNWNGCDISAIN